MNEKDTSMNVVNRDDKQMIYDSHYMTKPEFVDFYKTKYQVRHKTELSTRYLSTIWHSLRQKPRPASIKRKSCFDDIAESWTAPGWGPGDDPALRNPTKRKAPKNDSKKEIVDEPISSSKSRLEQVRELYNKGMTSPTAIAMKLNAHPSYVSTLIKKIKNGK